MVSILILTKNEQADLPGCLKSVAWCDDIHVYDSFSDDLTESIAIKAGAHVTKRKFDNWSSHQNWALDNIEFKHPWVFYLDADERASDLLYNVISNYDFENTEAAALELQRRDFAWDGTWLKHAQMSPFYLRIFKPDKIRYERLVNPVSIVNGPIERINGYLDHYPFSKGINFWIKRHIGYAALEAATRSQDRNDNISFSLKDAIFNSDLSKRNYHRKGIFYKLPLRPLIKFFYMLVIRRAFLDGRTGITYAILQSIYEYFIILNTRETANEKNSC